MQVINHIQVVARTAAHVVGTGAAVKQVVTLAAIEPVSAIHAKELVIAITPKQRVIARLAIDLVVARIARKHVIARTACNQVIAVAAKHHVVAAFGKYGVIAVTSQHHVTAQPGINGVVAMATYHQVVVSARINQVIAVAAINDVVAAVFRNDVIAGIAMNDVVAVFAKNQVHALGAVDLFTIWRERRNRHRGHTAIGQRNLGFIGVGKGHIGHCQLAAIRHVDGTHTMHGLAIDDLKMPIAGKTHRGHAHFGQGAELTRIRHTVLVGVLPDAELGPPVIQRVKNTITVAVKSPQTFQVSLRAILVACKADLARLVYLAVTVNVVSQQAVVLAYPRSAALPAVTVNVKEHIRVIDVGKFKTVAVQVNRNRFFAATAARCRQRCYVRPNVRYRDRLHSACAVRVRDLDLKHIGARDDPARRQVGGVVILAPIKGGIFARNHDAIAGNAWLLPAGVLEGSVGVEGHRAILRLVDEGIRQRCRRVVYVGARYPASASVFIARECGRDLD